LGRDPHDREDPEHAEYAVAVDWIKSVPVAEAKKERCGSRSLLTLVVIPTTILLTLFASKLMGYAALVSLV
jgi:hypothetical protein